MFLLEVEGSEVNSVEKELKLPTSSESVESSESPKSKSAREINKSSSNLQIDPRPLQYDDQMTFKITYMRDEYKHENGTVEVTTIATITRIHGDGYEGWWDGGWFDTLYFRVYDASKETVPSFTSTTYNYLGIVGERAPLDTVKTTIDPSVTIIREYAFNDCRDMEICTMIGDHSDKDSMVEAIQERAFSWCTKLRVIQLSKRLRYIGDYAFENCISLDAIFIPPSIQQIDSFAFCDCKNLRVVSLPKNQRHQQQINFGRGILRRCRSLFRITQGELQEYELVNDNSDDVHQSLINFYASLPPLHIVCLSCNVTTQTIHECIRHHGRAAAFTTIYGDDDDDGGGGTMTPLHILAMNPYVNPSSIVTCLELNINAAIATDDYLGLSPIDYLWEYGNINCLIPIIQALCLHREAYSISSMDTCSTQNQGEASSSKRKRVESIN